MVVYDYVVAVIEVCVVRHLTVVEVCAYVCKWVKIVWEATGAVGDVAMFCAAISFDELDGVDCFIFMVDYVSIDGPFCVVVFVGGSVRIGFGALVGSEAGIRQGDHVSRESECQLVMRRVGYFAVGVFCHAVRTIARGFRVGADVRYV